MADIHLSRDVRTLLAMLDEAPFPASKEWPAEKRQAAISMLWRDLIGKKPDLPRILLGENPNVGESLIAEVALEIGRSTGKTDPNCAAASTTQSANRADVLLVIPLPKEAFAGLVAFDGSPFEREAENLSGKKVWFRSIERSGEFRTLNVAIAVITKPRNVVAALETMDFLDRYNSEAAFLCGIGGGVKSKVSLGDVVATNLVIDVAGGVQQVDGAKQRPDPIPPSDATGSHIKFFVETAVRPADWRKSMVDGVEQLRSYEVPEMPARESIAAAQFKVIEGTIVAGERLVRDGSLEGYLQADNRIRSCDMEGSGFGQACNKRKVEWGVFRGISDHGDPDKADGWQAVAAFAAVRAARNFLASEFRLREEMVETKF